MDIEQDLKIEAPLRTQPVLTQVGGALIIVGVLLFGVVMPTHVLVLFLGDLCAGKLAAFPWWKSLLPLPIFLGFLAVGSWMAHGVIQHAYEIARPRWILLAVAAGSAATPVVAGVLGYGLSLFLVEVIGIPACLVAGFVLAKVGKEIGEIATGHSAGGGLGALAGLVLGYLYCDGSLKTAGCAVAGGFLAEGLGRLIRVIVRSRGGRALADRPK